MSWFLIEPQHWLKADVKARLRFGSSLDYIQNTEHIISITKTAAFRVPDKLDKGAKIIGEVTNVTGKLSYTAQLKDFVQFAKANKGYTFELRVPRETQFTKPMNAAIREGQYKNNSFSII